jgi:hypothetical protein
MARGRPGIESCSAVYPALAEAFRASLVESARRVRGALPSLRLMVRRRRLVGG